MSKAATAERARCHFVGKLTLPAEDRTEATVLTAGMSCSKRLMTSFLCSRFVIIPIGVPRTAPTVLVKNDTASVGSRRSFTCQKERSFPRSTETFSGMITRSL